MRIVLVGAGLTGGNTAASLREEGFDGEIVILGDEPSIPFGRPPLSKTFLRDEEDLSSWLVKPSDWYGKNDVQLRPDARVERVDPVGGRVVLVSGEEVTCDRVCIATGCRARVPDVPGIDLEGVRLLRTKADADAIKDEASKQGAKAAVIGMSFIGSEVAASLRQLGVEVASVFPGRGPLASVLGDRVADAMGDIHRGHGVELFPEQKLAEIRGHGRAEEVVTESGQRIACTFVVLGVGVKPNVDTVEGTDVAVDNGVLVDATCRTSVENVFAAGDVANHDHPLLGRLRVEHYNNAEKQGRHVARSMLGSPDPYDYLHSFWSDQYDDKLEYVGDAKEWDEFVIRGDVEARSFLGLYVKDGVLRAAMGLNRGGDPEAESDSELAACGELIRTQQPVDAAFLAESDAPVRAPGS